LDYSRLTTFLWKGLQEVIQITETQQREIDTLKSTVETQQKEIDTLKQQMNAILAKLG
jgi:cell division protein FtsB